MPPKRGRATALPPPLTSPSTPHRPNQLNPLAAGPAGGEGGKASASPGAQGVVPLPAAAHHHDEESEASEDVSLPFTFYAPQSTISTREASASSGPKSRQARCVWIA
jgi:hypothetical protein